MTAAAGIATFFGAGRLPKAPGTWGSLAALPCAWALHYLGGFPLLALATAIALVAGLWASGAHMAATGQHDPGEIVIDEVVGQWIALWPLSFGLWNNGVAAHVFPWPGWVGAFVFFRLFDILKPGPVGWADRQPGAFGVMMDDVIAGVFAAIVVMIGAGVAHGFLM